MNLKKLRYTVLLCIVLSACIGCTDTYSESGPAENINSTDAEVVNEIVPVVSAEFASVDKDAMISADSVDNYDISTANNAFAFDMYAKLKNDGENFFFSPYSISTAVSICYDGAEGSTKEQISNVFYYPLSKSILGESSKEMIDTINSENDEYDLQAANALWVQNSYQLNEQYIFNAENYYRGMITPLDFVNEPKASTDTINNWVEKKTNEKIKNLISEDKISLQTRLVITNTIYFNGKWVHEFDADDTRTMPFTLSSGHEKSVPTMNNREQFNYGENQKAKILELPYKGDNLCMYMVLPRKNNITKFENGFTLKDYSELKDNMNSEGYVNIWIPKFTFKTGAELKSPLTEMGVIDAFNQEKADFSGIAADGNLVISEIYHQAFVDVHEKGTEAAAATGVIIEECAMDSSREFKADHPFLFFIEDKRTGSILFMGKVEEPEY
ncbi:serpin family protein [Methanolobus sp. ZRKC3]|uniref:serpin family protein n=1 Tax=Methanolobus sp. ZRKC3 TaxID=3125786 RepID=UPI00324F3B0E